MRIGILTFHRSINYGAYMQCLALSHEIKKRFPKQEVEVIDYNSFIMEKNYKVRFTKHMLKHPFEFPRKIKRKRVFRNSLKYLPLSPEQIIDDGCDRVFEYMNSRYDVVIVGSDAVWNWIKRGFPNPYLLACDAKFVRMSYAASAFGMGMEYVTDERRDAFGASLSGYDFVGVRDDYTDSLVSYCAPNVKTHITCDPTAFLDLGYVHKLLELDKEQFKSMIYDRYKIPRDKRLICFMGTNKKLVSKVRKKYSATHRTISVFSSTGEEDVFMYDLSPLEWALLFGICDVTLTNFFHGTMLSLRNSTPVIAIDHTKFGVDYKGKIQDVLERMDMGDCFFRLADAKADDWNCIVKKLDVILGNDKLRSQIDERRQNLSATSEPFFEALAKAISAAE